VRSHHHAKEEEPEISLITLYKKHRLNEEEIVQKFFKNLNSMRQNKDYHIRDFEEFYFKIRPKFSAKLVKLLLEVNISTFLTIIG
jgi:hypothetical protein